MTKIADQKILITGASGGLGKEMCHQFLQKKAKLILSDVHDGLLKPLVDELNVYGKENILATIPADLSSKEGCSKLYQETLNMVGIPDILVNNAGIAVFGPFSSVPIDKWEKILQINLYAPMVLTHLFLPAFQERKSGHIVNISSVAGLVAVNNLSVYSVSKFGLKAFGEALEKEVAPYGIRVTNVYPFFTRTAILQSEQYGTKEQKKVPEHLLSNPKEIVRAIVKGIESDQVHVHPDGYSKMIEVSNRFFPGLVNFLGKNLMEG